MDKVVNKKKRTRKRSEGKRRFIESRSDPPKIGSEQRKERPCRRCRYCRRARFHEADNPRTEARRAERPLRVYLYIVYIYTFTRASMHVRTFGRGYAAPRRAAPRRAAPGVYIYIPTYWGLRFGGTPSTRLDLRLFNSSACQKHQCTLCSLIVLFPFLSFSVFRPLPFDPFPSRSLFHAEPTLLLFLPFEYTSLQPLRPSLRSSRYNCLLSLVLSCRPSFPIFRLRSARCYPSLAAAWSLRGGERLGAIRCDNCP